MEAQMLNSNSSATLLHTARREEERALTWRHLYGMRVPHRDGDRVGIRSAVPAYLRTLHELMKRALRARDRPPTVGPMPCPEEWMVRTVAMPLGQVDVFVSHSWADSPDLASASTELEQHVVS